jgi:hypothetical protein
MTPFKAAKKIVWRKSTRTEKPSKLCRRKTEHDSSGLVWTITVSPAISIHVLDSDSVSMQVVVQGFGVTAVLSVASCLLRVDCC